jgi:transcription elongation factor Elf1
MPPKSAKSPLSSVPTAAQVVEELTGDNSDIKLKISKRKLERVPKSISQNWDSTTFVTRPGNTANQPTIQNGKYKCTYLGCNRSFNYSSSRRLHIRRAHTGERPFKCTQCDKAFHDSGALKAHTLIHDGVKFKCDICGKLLGARKTLKRHIKRVHQKSDTKWQCQWCGECSGTASGLETHIRRHKKAHKMEIYKLKVAFDAVKAQLAKQQKKYEEKINALDLRYKKRLSKYTGKKVTASAAVQQAAGKRKKDEDDDEFYNDGGKKKRSREI